MIVYRHFIHCWQPMKLLCHEGIHLRGAGACFRGFKFLAKALTLAGAFDLLNIFPPLDLTCFTGGEHSFNGRMGFGLPASLIRQTFLLGRNYVFGGDSGLVYRHPLVSAYGIEKCANAGRKSVSHVRHTCVACSAYLRSSSRVRSCVNWFD